MDANNRDYGNNIARGEGHRDAVKRRTARRTSHDAAPRAPDPRANRAWTPRAVATNRDGHTNNTKGGGCGKFEYEGPGTYAAQAARREPEARHVRLDKCAKRRWSVRQDDCTCRDVAVKCLHPYDLGHLWRYVI